MPNNEYNYKNQLKKNKLVFSFVNIKTRSYGARKNKGNQIRKKKSVMLIELKPYTQNQAQKINSGWL